MDVVVGRIAKAHGIGGELSVEVRTDSPDQRFVEGAVLTASARGGGRSRLTVSAVRPHGSRLLVRFDEVTGRDAAEAMRGALLLADTAQLTPIDEPDEYYDHQLEGLAAELTDGTPAGTVTEVVHSPGGELLAIDRSGRTALVPFVRAIVIEVDLHGGRVVLDPPEGLLDAD